MVDTNKKLIDELKRYNSKLDEHISDVDVRLVGSSLKNSNPKEQNDEFNHLFTQNLLDLRTEVSLLRKNLSVDIEGMVMKVVNEQQNLFSEKMNNLFLQTTLDMKGFLNDMVVKFGDEITQIKKSYNEMSIQNSNVISKVTTLGEEVLILRDEFHSQKFGQSQIDVNRKLNEIENTIKLSQTLINENNQSLKNHFSTFNKSLNNLSKISLTSIPKPPSRDSHLKLTKKIFVKNDPFESRIIGEDPKVVSFDFNSEDNLNSPIPNKILDIDSRLSKLNNLK